MLINFPKITDSDFLRKEITNASTNLGDNNELRIIFNDFIETGALAQLASWLLFERNNGKEIKLEGKRQILGYLARMHLQGLAQLRR